ncbi:putative manganese-dependent inorganic diphosphatase [Akkermansiaceae bacterium]|nr:putative manganese-dependent inorganic diphosphatase [Akkermansiaceae bacterium]MDA7519756.1 putative manganese-dependent inorganic diphosphatase [bacterium]MDA7519137.1 putative manganese-dependent inorganic diphosphatase [Akkermansiaceae bacterium]MDA7538557.1 putative manganese-dependent inorganic diphosphatase [Akkermansiaceae bacterium]MDA7675071.1 putative manganese-dependent inorganic diphosphatase [Akkermansiaceae bacterium]
MTTPWYVIGHRNPDADAICAAMGHAAYLRAMGDEGVEAARCGEVPPRVKIVLEKAGLEAPKLIDDVRPTAGSISRKNVVSVRQDDTFLMAYRMMVDHSVRSVPVVNNGGEVCGLLHFLDLLQLLLPPATDGRNVKLLHASLENISATLGAGCECGASPSSDEEDLIMMVGASSQNTVEKRLKAAKEEGNVGQYLVICGDRPFVHQQAYDYGARALLVTGGYQPDAELAQKAKEAGMIILCSPHDTATTVKLALCARKVRNILSDDFISLPANEVAERFAKKITDSSQDLFPVVEPGTKRLSGVFSKSDLVNPPRVRLSLVDHNEFSQAVMGVEDAQIIEIIDHHRLSGDLISRDPVRFINEPVGSSSTIVARRFREKGLEPDAATALLLCAGLVSDTLNLTSPTTTVIDRDLLAWLAGLAGVNPDQFAEDFFASGSLLINADAKAIVGTDRKEFSEDGVILSLAQVEETSLKGLSERKEELIAELSRLRDQHGYGLCALLVTDITRHHSVLLAVGQEAILIKLPFDRTGDNEFAAPAIVSRKKQLFPAVCEALRLRHN